ncbi:HAUS augmin-like complex subunit 8 [Arapaima gigas]
MHRSTLGDSNNSKDGSQNSSGNGGAKKKPPAGVVKSRYLQAIDKKQPAKTVALKDSTVVAPQPASPKTRSGYKPVHGISPRRSVASQSLLNPSSAMACSILEPSQLGGNILQSTVLDGHCVQPEFDVSAIKAEKTAISNVLEPQNVKMTLEMQTLMLAFLTAKMEIGNKKLKVEAEGNLLLLMDEAEQMRRRVHEKKRQHLLVEKHKQLNNLLDMQVTALSPVATAVKQFTDEYKVFATSLDTTCHELPVKNFYIKGDRREFLDKTKEVLEQSERILLGCTGVPQTGVDRGSDLLSKIRGAAHELNDQLSRVFVNVQELSALVSEQTVHIQQSLEEDRLGMTRAQTLYLPRH